MLEDFHTSADNTLEDMKQVKLVLLLIVGLLGARCLASGTYPPGGSPRPMLAMDRGKLELGRAIYAGQAKFGDGGADSAFQRQRLAALQAKLPTSARRSTDLTALAGKLSATQLDALESFLEARFEIRL